MIIHLKSGETKELGFTASAAAGYVVAEGSRIELNYQDFNHIVNMMERDPANFRAVMHQLRARFPENRIKF